jgi:aspartate/methionine/tyrosine aminotransferase
VESVENQAIREASVTLWAALSPLGRRVSYPRGIPFQAAEARSKAFNGTIGQITDGRGAPLALPLVERALSGLDDADRRAGLLYSPVSGLPALREAWRRWQRRDVAEGLASTLPLVTVGLTHGLALIADLFAGEGRAVAVAAPFWGNYRQTFAVRTGAKVLPAPAYRDGLYNPRFVEEALADVAAGEPALAIVNLPSNPGGYSPTARERDELLASLCREAERRPLVVICDDAYAGLVYEEGVPSESLFWPLQDLHPQLIPIKVDGATKELSLFGGRVGFLTFPFEALSDVAAALVSKVMCLLRATVGSPVALAQVVLLQALREDGIAAEVEQVRQELAARYRVLVSALAEVESPLVRPLPCNAGCFSLLELGEGIDAESVRRHLLAEHDTGLVSIDGRYLRIAFCSVAKEDLPELVRRLRRAIEEVVAAGLEAGPLATGAPEASG